MPEKESVIGFPVAYKNPKNTSKMKKISLYFIVFLTMTASLFAKDPIPVAQLKTHEIAIDGKDNDWDKIPKISGEDTGMNFQVSNDKSTLYLNFTTVDLVKIMNLSRYGWKLDFLIKGEKSKTKAKLEFDALPVDNNRPQMDRGAGPRQNGAPNATAGARGPGNMDLGAAGLAGAAGQAIKNLIKNQQSFKANGFLITKDIVSMQSNSGIVVRVGETESSGLLYEMAIPLNELFEGGTFNSSDVITMGIAVSEMPMLGGAPGGAPGGGGGGGGPRGGGGGGGGMSGAGAPAGMPSGGPSISPAKITSKYKFTLAAE